MTDQDRSIPTTAQSARTMAPDSTEDRKSGVTLWREVDALGSLRAQEGASRVAIDEVLNILERHGFTEYADTPEIGQGGTASAQSDVSGCGGASETSTGSGGAEIGSDGAAFSRWKARHGIGQAIANGVVTDLRQAEVDPTPEEQRERFQAIAATPRPTTAEIKSTLEALEDAAETMTRGGDWTPEHVDDHTNVFNGWEEAVNLRDYAKMIDRLGVEVVLLDLKRDDMRAQLDRIAANAQPVDGTDLAELVQEARRWEESNRTAIWSRRKAGQIMLSLIGAVNDQTRRLREADESLAESTKFLDAAAEAIGMRKA